MKLSGNKKNGRYTANNNRNMPPQPNRSPEEQYVGPRAAKAALKKKKMRRTRNILTAILVVIIALAAVLYCVYKLGVRPPEMRDKDPINNAPSTSTSDGTTVIASPDRKGIQYTFVILGLDDGNGNTDTIMVANFDADNHKLSVVNIPRDTLVNVKWSTKKANTLYANGGIESVTKGLSDILGFPVDFYVKVDLKAFSTLVDAVDGIDFDVPVNMDYDDPAQDLHIHLDKGMQHLDGDKALQLVRCRSVYSTADIGRIETQQLFLKAAAEQILLNQKKLDITELANIFINDVETDLDVGEVIWLGKEFYKMESENVTFATLPADYWDTVNKTSYVTIYVNDWLQLLNEKINPYKEDFTAEDLSILSRNANGTLYVTNGVYAGKKSWGSGSSSSESNDNSETSAKPSDVPSPSPSSEPSPSDDPSPSPSDGGTSPNPSGEDSSPDASPTETEGDVSPSPTPDISPSPSPIENP